MAVISASCDTVTPSSLDGDSSRLPSDAGRAHPRPWLRAHGRAGPPSRPDTGDVSVSGLAGIKSTEPARGARADRIDRRPGSTRAWMASTSSGAVGVNVTMPGPAGAVSPTAAARQRVRARIGSVPVNCRSRARASVVSVSTARTRANWPASLMMATGSPHRSAIRARSTGRKRGALGSGRGGKGMGQQRKDRAARRAAETGDAAFLYHHASIIERYVERYVER